MTLHSDPNRIKQILLNLLSNSLKFTNEGSITVEVASEQFDWEDNSITNLKHKMVNKKNLIKITVSDTGTGMPPEVISRLFNQYATFDHNNGSNKHGVGLGLFICRRLVGLLGPSETIKVESKIGMGSKFSFMIYC